MKMQKRFIRKVKDKDYYKYVVNVPPMMVREAGIEEGDELEIKAEKDRLVLKKKKINGKLKSKKPFSFTTH